MSWAEIKTLADREAETLYNPLVLLLSPPCPRSGLCSEPVPAVFVGEGGAKPWTNWQFYHKHSRSHSQLHFFLDRGRNPRHPRTTLQAKSRSKVNCSVVRETSDKPGKCRLHRYKLSLGTSPTKRPIVLLNVLLFPGRIFQPHFDPFNVLWFSPNLASRSGQVLHSATYRQKKTKHVPY